MFRRGKMLGGGEEKGVEGGGGERKQRRRKKKKKEEKKRKVKENNMSMGDLFCIRCIQGIWWGGRLNIRKLGT